MANLNLLFSDANTSHKAQKKQRNDYPRRQGYFWGERWGWVWGGRLIDTWPFILFFKIPLIL